MWWASSGACPSDRTGWDGRLQASSSVKRVASCLPSEVGPRAAERAIVEGPVSPLPSCHPPPVRRVFLIAPDNGVVAGGLGGDGHDAGAAPVRLLRDTRGALGGRASAPDIKHTGTESNWKRPPRRQAGRHSWLSAVTLAREGLCSAWGGHSGACAQLLARLLASGEGGEGTGGSPQRLGLPGGWGAGACGLCRLSSMAPRAAPASGREADPWASRWWQQ